MTGEGTGLADLHSRRFSRKSSFSRGMSATAVFFPPGKT
ncbi:Uncharacterized protein EbC_28660 [Erwinia billingiae Eb661]|uniref:Uncharacterized protein n=1 Tax=Erwinia billingiae (strain Eb661) TaxID=634500 RepID=D8MU90_ERWBE|nr:Uncharacterized protein EbC_28660 [Erwinia billingiae Eb661]